MVSEQSPSANIGFSGDVKICKTKNLYSQKTCAEKEKFPLIQNQNHKKNPQNKKSAKKLKLSTEN